jgi:formamidopyrimidine-DNA glycosylase
VIERSALGRRIDDVDDTDTWSAGRTRPARSAPRLLGRRLVAAHRRGKSMWVETSGDHVLGIHLGMSGRILVTERDGASTRAATTSAPARNGRRSSPSGTVSPCTSRTAARCGCSTSVASAGSASTRHRGPRPGRRRGPARDFRTGRRVADAREARLLDQHAVAGVGNLLADEVLWQAAIAPERPADELDAADVARLHRELRTAIRHAIKRGGCTPAR